MLIVPVNFFPVILLVKLKTHIITENNYKKLHLVYPKILLMCFSNHSTAFLLTQLLSWLIG